MLCDLSGTVENPRNLTATVTDTVCALYAHCSQARGAQETPALVLVLVLILVQVLVLVPVQALVLVLVLLPQREPVNPVG